MLGAIGQVARAVDDIVRAKAWYADVLGLPHLYSFGKLAFFDCGGTRLMLEDRSILEVSDLRNDSVIYFFVPGIQAVGTHPDGTEEWMAFFKDCDGKLLAIMSPRKPA